MTTKPTLASFELQVSPPGSCCRLWLSRLRSTAVAMESAGKILRTHTHEVAFAISVIEVRLCSLVYVMKNQ